ncbi:MAG: carbon storage regulator [Planctomycetaceae bacterium]
MPVVISCQAQDEVRIGDSVGIVVLEVTESHVRLGITSPHQVPEYQEQIIYVADEFDEETDGTAELGRQLVGV